MSVNLLNLKGNIYFEKLLVTFIIISIFHKSYIPLKYIPYEKNIIFIILMISISYIFLYYFKKNNIFTLLLNRKWKIEKTKSFLTQIFFKNNIKDTEFKDIFYIIMLYALFLSYAVNVSYIYGPFLSTNIVLLSLLSYPAYACLGIFCSKYKEVSITIIFFLSFIYLLFSLNALYFGIISIKLKGFQNIFSHEVAIGKSLYQNINLYLGIFSIISSSFIIYERNKLYTKFFSIILLLISIFLMTLIGGRGSFISALIVIFFQFILCIYQQFSLNKKYSIFYLVLFCLLIITVLLLFSYFSQYNITLKRLSMLQDLQKDPSERITLFTQAFNLFAERPFFGSGLGSFPYFIGKGDVPGWYPHNFILELLCELGIFGLCLFFIPFYFIFKRINKNELNDFYSNTLLFLLVYLFIMSMGSGSVANLEIIVFLSCVFVFNLRDISLKDDK